MAIQKLKTVFSTGAWINSVKTFFTKINEIIDYLNINSSTISPTYKVYEGSISQTGEFPPTMNSFVDTVGITSNWTYVGSGIFTLSDSALLGYSKGTVIVSQSTGHSSGLTDIYTHNVVSIIDLVGGTIYVTVCDPENKTGIDGGLSNSYIKIVLWS